VPDAQAHHTFLFADLAGFTALTEAHGDEAAAGLAEEFSALVSELLPPGGEQVKSIGDAVMLRVPDARDAIALALEIVDQVRRRERFPVVRVGMHTGPGVERSGDWFGAAVNVAARISAAALGDEVLLSEATLRAAGQLADMEVESRGQARFRNVADPVRLYRALRSGGRHEDLAIDPVCHMTVAPERAAGRLLHDGHEYSFCSLECAGAFARDPGRYVEPPELV
jgi:adenylate cyclase